MRTVSLQNMPNGFEFELPSFGYWFKAGAAFTLGAALVAVLLWLGRTVLIVAGLATLVAALGR